MNYSLREKCPYSELFWSPFSCIRTEYGEILRISPCSVQMWKNGDQNKSEYGHFLPSDLEVFGCNYLAATQQDINGYQQLLLGGSTL